MIRSALSICAVLFTLLAVLAAPSCESGPRFYIDMSARPKSAGAGDSEYWVLYLDWNNFHRDLQRDLDNPRIAPSSLGPGFSRATGALQLLEEHFPPAEREKLREYLRLYDEMRADVAGGGNRHLVLQRLDGLGKAIRAEFHPDRLPKESPPDSEGAPVPAAAGPAPPPA